MRTLFLSDNAWTISRDRVRTKAGTIPEPGLDAHCFLAETADGAAVPITGLEATVPITAGVLEAPLTGAPITDAIEPLLVDAETAGDDLILYEHVVVVGLHHDVEELSVSRIRLATQ